MNTKDKSEGSILVLTIIVLVFLGVVIMGVAHDVIMDLFLTRNTKLGNQAHFRADSGFFAAEEMIGYAIDSRGGDNNTSIIINYGTSSYTLENIGDTLLNNNSTLLLKKDGKVISQVNVQKLGLEVPEGGSIIIAAGYEGLGKVAGSGSNVSLVYKLVATGNSTEGKAKSSLAEIYRYRSGGR
jgi:Tfp pilus assembly protein PilX